MKKLFLTLAFPLLFLLCGSSFQNFPFTAGPAFLFPLVKKTDDISNSNKFQDDRSKLHKEFKTEEGKTLTINLNSGGSISIKGWDKNLFSADVEAPDNNLNDFDINFSETGSGIKVESDTKDEDHSNNHGLNFIFMVPSRFNLDIQTMGGPIILKNIDGEITGQTMGGPLDLSNLKGNLDLETMGGPIKLYDSEVNGRVHTMGGPVEITNVKGNVKGTTNGGPVIMKNVSLKDNDSNEGVKIYSMGGDITVDEAPAGAYIETKGGSIVVRSAKKFVNAKTFGGDISIESTDGEINASTMGGDVSAEMVGNPEEGEKNVKLSSKAGDITLIVPERLSMDIDIVLAYTKRNENKYTIYSDFPLNKETTPDWNHTKGTARKYIYAKGKTGNGKNRISIETINGNIYLKKS